MSLPPCNITFCVGAPRSGTTLVSSLLSEGPTALPMLPECTFIAQLIRQFHDILHYADRPRFLAFAKSTAELVNVFSPAIDGFVNVAYSHFRNLEGCELILKDPELTLYLDCLPPFFPEFKAVCVVRDPRSVIASLRRVFAKKECRIGLDELIGMVYNYYYRASTSNLAKANGIHFVNFEKISNGEKEEFDALESYLGYRVGRRGFGKVAFNFDKTDATFSQNYGNPSKPLINNSPSLTIEESAKVQDIFSGYNLNYQWWQA